MKKETKSILSRVLLFVVIGFIVYYAYKEIRTYYKGKTVTGILLTIDRPYSKAQIELGYGYYIGNVGYIESSNVSIDEGYQVGECANIKYDPTDPFVSLVIGGSYECSLSRDKMILYGNVSGVDNRDSTSVELIYPDTSIIKFFASNKYFMPLRIGVNCDIVFSAKERRHKLLKLDFNGNEGDWMFNLDAKFEPGNGTDTTLFEYSLEDTTWVKGSFTE